MYKLDKMVLSVRGNAAQFLSGLTSNTLEAPHNAFLNLHGRIIATFDQVRTGDDEFLLVIAPHAWEPLKAHIDKFARLSKTTILPTAHNVYFDLTGDFSLAEKEYVIPQKTGQLIVTTRPLLSDISVEAFTLFRLLHKIPLHGIDYHDDFILNVHEHDFVSYTKGCFLGQEPVAKVHNRSKPTWKLEVRYEDGMRDEDKVKMTSKIKEPYTNGTLGFVFVKNI